MTYYNLHDMARLQAAAQEYKNRIFQIELRAFAAMGEQAWLIWKCRNPDIELEDLRRSYWAEIIGYGVPYERACMLVWGTRQTPWHAAQTAKETAVAHRNEHLARKRWRYRWKGWLYSHGLIACQPKATDHI